MTFDARAGQTIVVDLEAKRLGSKLNGFLSVIDPAGRIVATSNDFNDDSDPFLALPRAGRWTVRGAACAIWRWPDRTSTIIGCRWAKFRMSRRPSRSVWPPAAERDVHLVGYNLPTDAIVKVAAEKAGEEDVPWTRIVFAAAAG